MGPMAIMLFRPPLTKQIIDNELSWKSASNPSCLFFATRATERKFKVSSPHARIASDCHQPSPPILSHFPSCVILYLHLPTHEKSNSSTIMGGSGEENIVVVLKVINGSVLN